MSKRLQVVVDDNVLQRYEQAATVLGLTLSAWVRQVLNTAQQEVAIGDFSDKLAAIRAASQHSFPTADIEGMLTEIERGYLATMPP